MFFVDTIPYQPKKKNRCFYNMYISVRNIQHLEESKIQTVYSERWREIYQKPRVINFKLGRSRVIISFVYEATQRKSKMLVGRDNITNRSVYCPSPLTIIRGHAKVLGAEQQLLILHRGILSYFTHSFTYSRLMKDEKNLSSSTFQDDHTWATISTPSRQMLLSSTIQAQHSTPFISPRRPLTQSTSHCTPSTTPPSSQPYSQPSNQSSPQPSSQPSPQTSSQPSSRPSSQGSSQPSSQPSRQLSSQPSSQPSCQTSSQPSRQPSLQPSSQPSCQPSSQCSS